MKLGKTVIFFLMLSFFFFGLTLFTIQPTFALEWPEIEFQSKYIFESDIDSQNGEITIFEAEIQIEETFDLTEDIPLKAGIGAKHFLVDDTNVAITIPDAFKSRGIHLDTHLPLPFDDSGQFSLGLGINPSFQSGKGMKFDSRTFRLRGSAYLVHKHSEDLTIEAGASFRPEYDTDIFPLV